jgi:hypothetical protein
MTVALNVTGNPFPPMLIYPKMHFKNRMLTGALKASTGGANPTGWSNEKLLVNYLKHFITL